ncbi:MAG: hypothetical protein LBH25_09425 [Fibromonadaceae bacterium]|jgi:hypothetical protein|nr:hypothetical protein [Fibromonadaceae bacterium]
MKRYFSLALLAALAAFLAFLAACGDAEIEPWDFNDYMLATEGQGEALDDFIKNWIEECSGEDSYSDKCGSINGGGGNSSASTGGDGDDNSSSSAGGDGDDNSSASTGGDGDDNSSASTGGNGSSSSSKNNSSSSKNSSSSTGSSSSSSSKNSSSSTGGGSGSSSSSAGGGGGNGTCAYQASWCGGTPTNAADVTKITANIQNGQYNNGATPGCFFVADITAGSSNNRKLVVNGKTLGANSGDPCYGNNGSGFNYTANGCAGHLNSIKEDGGFYVLGNSAENLTITSGSPSCN